MEEEETMEEDSGAIKEISVEEAREVVVMAEVIIVATMADTMAEGSTREEAVEGLVRAAEVDREAPTWDPQPT